jgi:hypothetical protein
MIGNARYRDGGTSNTQDSRLSSTMAKFPKPNLPFYRLCIPAFASLAQLYADRLLCSQRYLQPSLVFDSVASLCGSDDVTIHGSAPHTVPVVSLSNLPHPVNHLLHINNPFRSLLCSPSGIYLLAFQSFCLHYHTLGCSLPTTFICYVLTSCNSIAASFRRLALPDI